MYELFWIIKFRSKLSITVLMTSHAYHLSNMQLIIFFSIPLFILPKQNKTVFSHFKCRLDGWFAHIRKFFKCRMLILLTRFTTWSTDRQLLIKLSLSKVAFILKVRKLKMFSDLPLPYSQQNQAVSSYGRWPLDSAFEGT